MQGPFILNEKNVRDKVDDYFMGVFKLSVQEGGSIRRVGRGVLRDQLVHWANGRLYRQFWFDYVSSEEEAYQRHCELWHASGGRQLDSAEHPKVDPGQSWSCPECNQR